MRLQREPDPSGPAAGSSGLIPAGGTPRSPGRITMTSAPGSRAAISRYSALAGSITSHGIPARAADSSRCRTVCDLPAPVAPHTNTCRFSDARETPAPRREPGSGPARPRATTPPWPAAEAGFRRDVEVGPQHEPDARHLPRRRPGQRRQQPRRPGAGELAGPGRRHRLPARLPLRRPDRDGGPHARNGSRGGLHGHDVRSRPLPCSALARGCPRRPGTAEELLESAAAAPGYQRVREPVQVRRRAQQAGDLRGRARRLAAGQQPDIPQPGRRRPAGARRAARPRAGPPAARAGCRSAARHSCASAASADHLTELARRDGLRDHQPSERSAASCPAALPPATAAARGGVPAAMLAARSSASRASAMTATGVQQASEANSDAMPPAGQRPGPRPGGQRQDRLSRAVGGGRQPGTRPRSPVPARRPGPGPTRTPPGHPADRRRRAPAPAARPRTRPRRRAGTRGAGSRGGESG